jgi:hypothetical protein
VKFKGLLVNILKNYMPINWKYRKIDKFLSTHDKPKLNPEDIWNVNRSTPTEIKTVL